MAGRRKKRSEQHTSQTPSKGFQFEPAGLPKIHKSWGWISQMKHNHKRIVGWTVEATYVYMEGQRLVSCGVVAEDPEMDEELVLKGRIACHPMFGLLKETHLSCLKVCMGDYGERDEEAWKPNKLQCDVGGRKSDDKEGELTDLDLFMEAYYMMLVELKNAIQKPMQEASGFVEFMHCLLHELSHPPVPIATASASPGEAVGGDQCKCELLLCGCGGAVETVTAEMGKLALD